MNALEQNNNKASFNELLEKLLAEKFSQQNGLAEATLENLETVFSEFDEQIEAGVAPPSFQALKESYDRCKELYCLILMELENLNWRNQPEETLEELRDREDHTKMIDTKSVQNLEAKSEVTQPDPLSLSLPEGSEIAEIQWDEPPSDFQEPETDHDFTSEIHTESSSENRPVALEAMDDSFIDSDFTEVPEIPELTPNLEIDNSEEPSWTDSPAIAPVEAPHSPSTPTPPPSQGLPREGDDLFLSPNPKEIIFESPEEDLTPPQKQEEILPDPETITQSPLSAELLALAKHFQFAAIQNKAPLSPHHALRLQAQALCQAVENECRVLLAPAIKPFWPHRESAIRALLDSRGHETAIHPILRKALDEICERSELMKDFPHNAVLNAMKFILNVHNEEKFVPAPIEAGTLLFFFGQDHGLNGIQLRNYFDIKGVDEQEMQELFLRLLRTQSVRNKIFLDINSVIDMETLEADTHSIIHLLGKIRILMGRKKGE